MLDVLIIFFMILTNINVVEDPFLKYVYKYKFSSLQLLDSEK